MSRQRAAAAPPLASAQRSRGSTVFPLVTHSYFPLSHLHPYPPLPRLYIEHGPLYSAARPSSASFLRLPRSSTAAIDATLLP